MTSDGRVADEPLPGLPFLTGSEENRGPLFDLTHQPFEGRRAPIEGFESQGHKIGIPFAATKDSYPYAVPLFVRPDRRPADHHDARRGDGRGRPPRAGPGARRGRGPRGQRARP